MEAEVDELLEKLLFLCVTGDGMSIHQLLDLSPAMSDLLSRTFLHDSFLLDLPAIYDPATYPLGYAEANA